MVIGEDLLVILSKICGGPSVYSTLGALLPSILVAVHDLVCVDRPNFRPLDDSHGCCVLALSNSKLGYERDGPLTPR